MLGYLPILNAVLPVFLVMLIGFVLRRGKVLTSEADASLLRLVFNVLFPAFILDVLLGNPAAAHPRALLVVPMVGFCLITAGYGVAYLVGGGLRLDPVARRTFGFSAGIFNYGFIPIFIVMQLFDDGGRTLGTLFVHNIGVDIAIWSVGIMLLSGSRGWGGLRRLVNGPLLAVTIGLLINFVGLDVFVPQALLSFIKMLGACAVPMGVMLAGATLGDCLEGERLLHPLRIPVSGVLIRLVILPAAMLLLAVLLPVSIELKRVIVVQASMPAGLFAIVITRHYGGSVRTALTIIISTTLISLFTIPLVVSLGMKLIGE